MKSKAVFLGIVVLGLTINIFSQTKAISSEDFYRPIRAVHDFKGALRKTSKEEFYKDGKLSGTIEIIDETLGADRRRYLHIEKEGTKTEKTELIQIGKIFYCRKNGNEWKQSENRCAGGRLSGISNIISSKFIVEDVKFNNENTKLYQQYTTSADDKNAVYYLQDKFWLNSSGLLIRREIEYGKVQPKSIGSRELEVYEYNPKNLKIEAPIK